MSLSDSGQSPCPTCLGHDPNNFETRYYGEGQESTGWMSTEKLNVADMKASYDHGCRICSLVYRGIAAAEPDMVKCDSPMQWVIERDHMRLNRLDKRMGVDA